MKFNLNLSLLVCFAFISHINGLLLCDAVHCIQVQSVLWQFYMSVCLVVSFVHCVEMYEWIELVCAMDGIKDDVSRTLVLSGLVSLVLVVFINCCLGYLSWHLFVVIFVLLAPAKWSVRKTVFLHQSNDCSSAILLAVHLAGTTI